MLITISDYDPKTASLDLGIAAEAIMHGGTVIVGTETFYAIAANPFMDEAVEKIFSIKKRTFQNPLALIASDKKVVNSRISGFSKIAETLMKNFWPGSLTILFDGQVDFSKYVRNASGDIGVRVPPLCPARLLAEMVGGWITATSANISGDPTPKSVTDIPPEIIHSVDVVVDSGPCPGGLPSTVVDATHPGWKVLRIGRVSKESIFEALRESEIN